MKNMEPKIVSFSHNSQERKVSENTEYQIRVSDVFTQRTPYSYLNEFTLFTTIFNSIPNFIHEIEINCTKANVWFSAYYKNDIKDSNYSKLYYGKNKKAELYDIFYFLYDDLIVQFDTNSSKVRFLFKKTESSLVESVISGIRKYKKRRSGLNPEISLLVNSRTGIETKSLKIARPKLNIDDNYNDDFVDIHQIIRKRLTKKNDKGLVLLHGKPGTGKTSYIRYLISILRKEVIFLPPNMASTITSPDLISILIDHPNSIFVIEDAENIILDRNKSGNSSVSALLNISDGLLSDCLNIHIICSFNTDISKVDNALLRKGRLIAKYEFKELEVQKAQTLSRKLGFKTEFDVPQTLTAIYNQEEKDFLKSERSHSIGFKN